jgi:hypothetical protein
MYSEGELGVMGVQCLFKNISNISWWSVSLVDKTEVL